MVSAMRDLSPGAELRRLRLLERQVRRVLKARRDSLQKLAAELDSLEAALYAGARHVPARLWASRERRSS